MGSLGGQFRRAVDDPRIFAAVDHFVYGSTIHRSDDLGETWEPVTESPAYPSNSERELNTVWTVVPGRTSDPGTVYAGVDEAELFVSRAGGEHWEEVRGLGEHESRPNWFPGKGGPCCHSVLVDPTNLDRMWVAISAVGVFRTTDGGTSWTLENDGLKIVMPDDEYEGIGSCVHRLAHHPSRPERLFQQNHLGVFRSTNAADS